MYFITTKRMLEVCFFQHTPTFIIEPNFPVLHPKLTLLLLVNRIHTQFTLRKKVDFHGKL